MSPCYVAPASLSEALAFLAERGPDSTVLAGGMSLVPALKKGLLRHKFIVNIKGIGEPSVPALDKANACLTVGALVRHREIETSAPVAEHLPALRALEEQLACVQIRNHGTLAGNLCAAEPWSDPPCLLAALDATLVVVAARRERRVAAADWIVGDGETLRQPDELLQRIELPIPAANVGIGHARVAARQGLARPLACAAARIVLAESGNVTAARVFVGAVGPRPQRMTAVEAMLEGRRPNGDLARDIEHAVAQAIEHLPDERCSARYKTQVTGVLVRRAIADAVAHAGKRATGS
jgi:aerobic carbon-monoxide dehydrogenase medium subunit